MYDLVDMATQETKRTPFIKKHSSSSVTLGEFKETIFNRKGEYRCVFVCVCAMFGDEVVRALHTLLSVGYSE